MTRINVEDQKKAILDLNGIPPFEEEMTFYYDESGNCRKFSLLLQMQDSITPMR